MSSVATMSSLAQLRVWDGYREAEATQMRRRKADWECKHQKQAATRGIYRVANQQRMAARRALEWMGALKAQLVLDMKYQTCVLFFSKKMLYGVCNSVHCVLVSGARVAYCPREKMWKHCNKLPVVTLFCVHLTQVLGKDFDLPIGCHGDHMGHWHSYVWNCSPPAHRIHFYHLHSSPGMRPHDVSMYMITYTLWNHAGFCDSFAPPPPPHTHTHPHPHHTHPSHPHRDWLSSFCL